MKPRRPRRGKKESPCECIQRQAWRCIRKHPKRVAGVALCVGTVAIGSQIVRKEEKARPRSLPIIDDRDGLADILQAEGKTTGLEVGVKGGDYSERMLKRWSGCETYILMDPWEHQENWEDIANGNQDEQNKNMDQTMERMKPFKEKGVDVPVIRKYSADGRKDIQDDSLDFIYIDARHDYKAMMEDLEFMWPKLKEGGIFAGHDFVNANEEPKAMGQDWCIFDDGTRCENGKAVKAAVEEFAKNHGDRQIVVPRRETKWPSWYMRK